MTDDKAQAEQDLHGRPRESSIWSSIRIYLTFCTPAEKRRLGGAIGFSFVIALLQAVSVASVMPFLALVSDPGLIESNSWAAAVYEWVGFGSPSQFVVFAGVASIIVISGANLLTALGMRSVMIFVWDQHSRVTVDLFSRYLALPYLEFRNRHSADLTQKLMNESGSLSEGVAMQIVTLVSEGLSGLVIFTLLLVVDPVLAVVVATVLASMYAIIYPMVKRRQNWLGERRMSADRQRYRFSQDAFGGFKDYVLADRPQRFVAGFTPAAKAFSRSMRSSLLIGLAPRFIMEAVAFGGIILLALFFFISTNGDSAILPRLGLYAFGGYKLLPSLQHAFQAANRLQFYRPAVGALRGDLTVLDRLAVRESETLGQEPREIPEDWKELRASEICFSYPGGEAPALENVTIHVPRFATLGLVGPSGSGKSTFADVLMGLVTPSEGDVALDDWTLDGGRERVWRKFCGQVPQEIFLLDDTVAANVAFGLDPDDIDEDRVREALDAARVLWFVEKLPNGINTEVGERGARLSGGERQRIGIARALYRKPQLLVLDEATSSLDTMTEAAVMRSVESLTGNLTLIHVAHRISTVMDCDQIAVFDEGRVVGCGTYEELMESCGVFQRLVRGQDLSHENETVRTVPPGATRRSV